MTTGIGLEQHDHEGRVLTLEYPGFYLVNCYTPNSQDGLKRLDYRMTWKMRSGPTCWSWTRKSRSSSAVT